MRGGLTTTGTGVRVRPAALDDAPALGRLWWLTFPDKFGPAFGEDSARNVALLTDLHRAGGGRMTRATLVAEAAGRVVGFLLLHAGREGAGEFPLAEGWKAFHYHLGTLGAFRGLLLLVLMEIGHPRPPRDYVVVEMVGVDPAWQGHGVGRALMTAAIQRARSSGARAVSLDVVWGNTRARRLYESLGFRAAVERRSWLLERITGHHGWTRMVLEL